MVRLQYQWTGWYASGAGIIPTHPHTPITHPPDPPHPSNPLTGPADTTHRHTHSRTYLTHPPTNPRTHRFYFFFFPSFPFSISIWTSFVFILSFSCGYYAVSSVSVSAATRLAYDNIHRYIYNIFVCILIRTHADLTFYCCLSYTFCFSYCVYYLLFLLVFLG